jgi:type I restriction enzyme, S subunit
MVKRTLGSLLDLKDSGVWGDEDAELGVSILRSTNFQDDGTLNLHKLTHRKLEERDAVRKLLAAGDILLEKSGGGPKQPVGRVCFFEGDRQPHTFSNFIARLRATHEAVPKYLFYFLRHFHATGKTEGYQKQTTGIRNLEFKRFLDIELPLPPLDEQQRIVDILDRAASIQRLCQAADEKLKQIIPALFVDMFGDPATNPKGWQKSALGGLINIRSSVRLPDLVSEADELCIGADAISSGDGKLLFQPTVGSVMPKSGKYFFHEGDVLYSKIRPYLCKAWLADCAGYCSADIYAIECNEQLTPHFLKYLLLSKDFTDYAVAQSSRASMPKVNREALSAYEFPLPPVELQREFSARAERVLSLAKLSSEASGSGDLSMASLSSQFFNAA